MHARRVWRSAEREGIFQLGEREHKERGVHARDRVRVGRIVVGRRARKTREWLTVCGCVVSVTGYVGIACGAPLERNWSIIFGSRARFTKPMDARSG